MEQKGDSLPFTLPHSPAGNDPKGHHEDEQNRARANSHKRFKDESCVEVDSVQGADASTGGVREQFAV